MNIRYNITGNERKSLVEAARRLLDTTTKYCGAPSFAYEVGSDYRVAREGTLTGPDNCELVADLESLHSFKAVEETYDAETAAPAKPDKTGLPRLYTLRTPRGEISITEEFATHDEAAAEGYGEAFSTALGTVYSYGDNRTFALVTANKAGDWDTTTMGQDFREAAPAEPEAWRTYQAELSDPGCPDRMEVFSAENDEDAVRQAREFCEGEVVLLELLELNENYDVVGAVDLAQYPIGLTVELPLEGFDPPALDRLCRLVASKETLLKMALGVEALPIRVLEDRISLPWFPYTEDGDTILAYGQLAAAICRTAKEKQRVNAQPKEDYPNPKFTMRCWLISIGLSGPEFKLIRKLMTSTLPGNGAFSRGFDPRKVAAGEIAAPAADMTAETDAAGDNLPGEGEGADNE
jgi:hypothetical protein